jgi:outer membrane protein OmpA-like peptidoglycan-associated protein
MGPLADGPIQVDSMLISSIFERETNGSTRMPGVAGSSTRFVHEAGRVPSGRVASRLGIAAAFCLALSACQTTNPYTGEKQTSKTGIGAGIGAAGGAVAGLIIGGRKGALIGAGIGALAGGAVGYYMDQQEAKLREQLQGTGVSVTRSGDTIILNMPGNVTFATDSSDISADFYEVLDSVGIVLNEFEKTYVDVIGHTDSRGSADYNLRLSERRAGSVAKYLESREVVSQRILVVAKGESTPTASNDTESGRALNRRVEIKLSPLT